MTSGCSQQSRQQHVAWADLGPVEHKLDIQAMLANAHPHLEYMYPAAGRCHAHGRLSASGVKVGHMCTAVGQHVAVFVTQREIAASLEALLRVQWMLGSLQEQFAGGCLQQRFLGFESHGARHPWMMETVLWCDG